MEAIYLDHASAMPIHPKVWEFAEPFLRKGFGNPSSTHSVGSEAKKVVEEARGKIADFINAEEAQCIVFTSGATEANNLAIKGAAVRNMAQGKEIGASAIEHMSVLNPMKELQKSGFQLNRIPVDATGIVSAERLSEMVSQETTVTSVMYANNEIGTVEPIGEISEIVHQRGLYFHVDATAAAGRIPIDVQKDGIDLLTLSSNDLYGPQGAGATGLRR